MMCTAFLAAYMQQANLEHLFHGSFPTNSPAKRLYTQPALFLSR